VQTCALPIFNSIMWSNIFTESIRGLGKFTPYGSSLLVMMIVGGAVIPVIQGLTADKLGINASFAVPTAAYLYLVVFAGMKIYTATPNTTKQFSAIRRQGFSPLNFLRRTEL